MLCSVTSGMFAFFILRILRNKKLGPQQGLTLFLKKV